MEQNVTVTDSAIAMHANNPLPSRCFELAWPQCSRRVMYRGMKTFANEMTARLTNSDGINSASKKASRSSLKPNCLATRLSLRRDALLASNAPIPKLSDAEKNFSTSKS